MKRIAAAALVLVLTLVFAWCAGLAEASQKTVLFDETVSGWHIVIENVMVRSRLENITLELGYTDVQTNEFVWEAPEGKAVCLVKLNIEKVGSRESIQWEDMVLTDSAGTEYHRIDDMFIADLGMKRMPGTALNFGINVGWIAFEIDGGAAGLTLGYPFEETPLTCVLGV